MCTWGRHCVTPASFLPRCYIFTCLYFYPRRRHSCPALYFYPWVDILSSYYIFTPVFIFTFGTLLFPLYYIFTPVFIYAPWTSFLVSYLIFISGLCFYLSILFLPCVYAFLGVYFYLGFGLYSGIVFFPWYFRKRTKIQTRKEINENNEWRNERRIKATNYRMRKR